MFENTKYLQIFKQRQVDTRPNSQENWSKWERRVFLYIYIYFLLFKKICFLIS